MAKDSKKNGAVLIVLLIIMALTLGVCVAVCSDDDDDDSWAPATELVAARHQDHGGDDRSDGKNAHGKCENARQCQDDDFSPSFDNSR